MIYKKSILAFLLIITIIFGSACSNSVSPITNNSNESESTNTESNDTTNSAFTLLYCDNDSFNPYSASTKANQQLSLLLYDSLVKTDNKYKVHNSLASKIKSESNTEYKVYIKNATFTDGTDVTSKDIVYSVQLAKKSSTRYKNQLSKVKSCYSNGNNCIVFKLKTSSPNFKNSLDFPIIKYKSDKIKNKNKTLMPPVGSGRYILDLKNKQIKRNSKYHSEKPKIKTIQLLCAPDDESADHYIEMGGVSLVFTDLSDGNIPTMNGNLQQVKLNNLVYLGINRTKSSIMSNEYMRYAVATGIDRSQIVKHSYYSYADEALGPFRDEWDNAKSVQNLEAEQNIDVSVANLKKIGYNDKNTGGYFVNSNNDILTLNLVCNKNPSRVSAAKLIKKQLASVGIKVNINSLSWKEYKKALKQKNFDLYIAETKIESDLDITPLISNKSSLTYGMKSSGKLNSSAKAFNKYLKGESQLFDFINSFYSEMPFIPICFRNGVVISSKNLSSVPKSSYSDIFFGIENISINN